MVRPGKYVITETHPRLLEEWDWDRNKHLGLNPEQLSSGSHKRVYFICKKNSEHRWNTTIRSRVKQNKKDGCPFCSGKKASKENNLAISHPYILSEWDYERNTIKPEEITSGSSKRFFWICSKNPEHKWNAILNNRTRTKNNTGCPYCSGLKPDSTNCFAKTHPEHLKFWDYEKNKVKPEDFLSKSKTKVWWICTINKKHTWRASLLQKISQKTDGCPFCLGIKINHTNCLAATHSHLLNEWDFEKNYISPYEVSYGTGNKVYWICSKTPEHRWEASVASRTKIKHTSGCPYCSKVRINHTNCLSVTHPHLMNEWDYEKNILHPQEVPAGSNQVVYWKCSKIQHHVWKTRINSRTKDKNPSGCPFCSHRFSSGHQEVVKFLQSIYSGTILVNDTKQIKNPKTKRNLELDIFLPEKMFAIEYNGTYFHNRKDTENRDKIKVEECYKKGISLMVIPEEKWKTETEIVKNQIRNYLYLT